MVHRALQDNVGALHPIARDELEPLHSNLEGCLRIEDSRHKKACGPSAIRRYGFQSDLRRLSTQDRERSGFGFVAETSGIGGKP